MNAYRRKKRQFKTRGESFAARELKLDKGHYEPGQMCAKYLTDQEALFAFLTWVNRKGHVVAMMVRKKPGGNWEPALGTYRECGHAVLYPEEKLPKGYKLPEKTVRFLDEAEESWQRPEN